MNKIVIIEGQLPTEKKPIPFSIFLEIDEDEVGIVEFAVQVPPGKGGRGQDLDWADIGAPEGGGYSLIVQE